MAIIYKTDHEARKALLAGVEQLAKLVTITLGPKGRNVALDRLWSDPAIIHDGVSVAQAIELEDPFENMGAQLVKEAASKTADRAGDGTTTATLLAWKLIERGMRLLEEGVNPMMLKEGMDKAVTEIVHILTSEARPVNKGDIEKVATISAADPEVGTIIATAIERVGKDGVITVEEGMAQETTVEYKEGMMFDKGFAGTPAFVTNKKDMTAEILNPLILYTDMVIDNMQDFADFLDNVITDKNRNIVIICEGFEGMTLPMLIDNHQRGVIRALALKAPSFGLKRIWMLEDMATLTGGTIITRQAGRTLASVKLEELGHADKVWADTDNTKIIGGQGQKSQVKTRIEALKSQVSTQESEFEKKQLLQRIARLSGGVAVIKVGALTDTELKDKKERVIDAVEATKSALDEGIVAGGGVALLRCQDSLRYLLRSPFEEEPVDSDISEGVKLVLSVLDEPIRLILHNAGKTPEIILEKIKEKQQLGYGYDIIRNQYGDMQEMGVIDPVKVTRQALQNAVSVASMMLTTDGLVTKKPEDRKSPLENVPAV